MTLALEGGNPAIKGRLPEFSTIGNAEINAAADAVSAGALSGYMGGELHGGYWVEKLEEEFCLTFGSKHAIASNSATSGLLIACMACGVGPGTEVATTPYTMSATAAAPAFLGAKIRFGDIDPYTFNLETWPQLQNGKAVIATNLFGHPANLHEMRETVMHRMYLIEDNAQSIFAMERGKYAGTIGHVGVFSLNVHKHIHCGEGGICLTDDDELAVRMRMARNHGELAGYPVGLNLRMTEVTAAIALAQLKKRHEIMESRIAFGEKLTFFAGQFPNLTPPIVRGGCTHSYYVWAMKCRDRDWFVRAMNAEGFPIKAGYVEPLYNLEAFKKYKVACPVTEQMENELLCTFEICGYSPTEEQMKQIKDAFEKVAEAHDKRLR